MPRLIDPSGKPLQEAPAEAISREIGEIFMRESLNLDECTDQALRIIFQCAMNGCKNTADLTEYLNLFMAHFNNMANHAAQIIQAGGNKPAESLS